MSTAQQLKDNRATIVVQMRTLHDLAEKETRGFTTDEDAKWATMDADLISLDDRIKRAEKLDSAGMVVPTQLRAAGKVGTLATEPEDPDQPTESRAFTKFLKFGMAELTTEERNLMQGRKNDSKEIRALTAGTLNTGGYTVPQDFRDQLEVALKAYGGMMDASEIIYTDSGAALPMPSFNYTAVLATIVGEGVAGAADTSTPFGVATLNAFTYRSPILPVSYEFLQDSAFGEGFIVDALSGSIARALNAHTTVGTGTGQPRGLMLDAVSGKVGITGQTVSIISDDLYDLEHSVDPSYRVSGSKFMMHDSSFKVIRKLKDTAGRPVFFPGFDGLGGHGPDTILGYELVVNQDMPTMAANAKSIAFGRLDKYKLRMVKDITILRLTERYADQLQVAFILFARADGRLLDAGTNPVKYYSNSAT
ncbi:phage major capsid protein [Sulfuriferula sp.]|uniref:phage major capsid protein n=1 Tax=Sulfuriferula sp. TaxID=2025307 RepID=UPI002731A455|nr:phage major capsid protein [Sulfuriferula sp.]MDP2026440.1 phage major capsid protein [Sulfuriferula sp.]